MLGEMTEDGQGDVVAMKRVTLPRHSTTKLAFQAPDEPGMTHWYLYILSDTYVGLDQEYDVDFLVTPAKESSDDGLVVDDF